MSAVWVGLANSVWTKVVDAADTEFLLQNVGTNDVEVVYSVGAPSGSVRGHTLGTRKGVVRDTPGDVYVRSYGAAIIVVSGSSVEPPPVPGGEGFILLEGGTLTLIEGGTFEFLET